MNIIEAQAKRMKAMPTIVEHLVKNGCWIVGDNASFRNTSYLTDEWDVLVPPNIWESIVGSLPLESVRPTSSGGWCFKVDVAVDTMTTEGRRKDLMGLTITVTQGDIGNCLQNPFVQYIWHPKSGTIVERMTETTILANSIVANHK